MLWIGLLRMTAIALALAVAGIGYRVSKVVGKALFAVGVVTAVGLLVLASVACSALPDLAKSERQIADEAATCLQAGYGEEFAVLFPNGKDGIAGTLVQTSSREQLVTYRDQKCGKGIEDPAERSERLQVRDWRILLRGSNSGCTGCSSIQEMMDEYEANPLRAERNVIRGSTIDGGWEDQDH